MGRKNVVRYIANLLVCFDSRFGHFTIGTVTFLDGLDDSDGNSLSHISDGESSKWSVLGKWFDAHWLGWQHLDDGGITGFDLWWIIFNLLSGSSIDFLDHLVESASDMSGMAIQDWSVTFLDFTGVVQDDNLGVESFGRESWVFLAV